MSEAATASGRQDPADIAATLRDEAETALFGFGTRADWPVSRIMNRAVLHCPPDMPLDQAAAAMTERHCSCIVVLEAGRPVGIWTESDSLLVDLDDPDRLTAPIADVMSAPVRSIDADLKIRDLIGRFRDQHIRHFVVEERGHVAGIVTQTDVIRHQSLHAYLTLRDIGSLVRRGAVEVDYDDPVKMVGQRLRNSDLDAAVVMRDGVPYGLMTERDMLRLVAQHGTQMKVGEVCSHPLVMASRDMPLVQAHDLMERRHIRHLVVVDDAGSVVTVLCFADILGGIELDYMRFLQAALDRQKAAVRIGLQRQRMIIDATQEGYLEVDGALCIVDCNHAFERLVGRSRSEMLGRHPTFLCAENALRSYERQLERVPLETQRSYEVSFVRRDGSVVPLRVNATTMRDDTGRLIGSFGFYTDLTEIKQAERRLSEMIDQVSRSNQELESFAYVISHDLQEPLRMIASYLNLIERRYAGALDDTGREFIGFATGGAKRLQSMITDLLDYSRLGRLGDSFAPVDFNDACATAVRHLEAVVAERQGVVERDALPTLPADGPQIERLFLNLIGNALKYSRQGQPPRVQVSAHRSGGVWLFGVADNGIGIEPEFRERVFNMFQRLHPRDRYGGNGIGLSVCKRIVERHGGRIWVDGNDWGGTTVYFTIAEYPHP